MAIGIFGRKGRGLFAEEGEADEIVNPYSGESRPTAIIDIVFLLLIFFMCSSSFPILERRLDALLPDMGQHIGPPPPPPPPEYLRIEVSAAPGADAAPCYRIMSWQTGDANQLAARLAQLRDRKLQVVIDGSANCPFRHVMSALDACVRAGITGVGFQPPPAA